MPSFKSFALDLTVKVGDVVEHRFKCVINDFSASSGRSARPFWRLDNSPLRSSTLRR